MVPLFFQILEIIHQLKSELIIVSGRSLSWGHFFLTHFPLNAVIMEGGGVVVVKDKMGKMLEHCLVDEEELFQLNEIENELKVKFPGLPLSIDNFGRKTDRAIELNGLSQVLKGELEDFFKGKESLGLSYSCSNVHLNFWCGKVSKIKGTKFYLDHYRPEVIIKNCFFFGDSLNDESMFAAFDKSIGVSNISAVLEKLKERPKIILQGKENIGPWGVFNYLSSLPH